MSAKKEATKIFPLFGKGEMIDWKDDAGKWHFGIIDRRIRRSEGRPQSYSVHCSSTSDPMLLDAKMVIQENRLRGACVDSLRMSVGLPPEGAK